MSQPHQLASRGPRESNLRTLELTDRMHHAVAVWDAVERPASPDDRPMKGEGPASGPGPVAVMIVETRSEWFIG